MIRAAGGPNPNEPKREVVAGEQAPSPPQKSKSSSLPPQEPDTVVISNTADAGNKGSVFDPISYLFPNLSDGAKKRLNKLTNERKT